jgi:hypothetical protein
MVLLRGEKERRREEQLGKINSGDKLKNAN